MRHIWSLIAGLVAAPLTWLLLATGQASSSAVIAGWVAAGRGWDTHDLIEPAAFLVVAAVLIGLVATLRISPVGPIVAGLLLISGYVATFIEPLAVRDTIPNDWVILDRPVPLHVPLDNGTLALLGLMLLMAAFSVQRWRAWPVAAVTVASDAPVDPDATGELDGSDDPDDAGDLEAQAPMEADDREPAAPRNIHAVSALDEDTQELTLVSPPASATAPAQQPPAPRVTPVSAAPPRVAVPRKPSVPVTLASVAVPGPVVESPASKRAAAPQQPPTPKPSPAPAEPARRPPPGRPAPTDPDGPAPEEPPVPAARRPESPWSEPPTSSGNRTRSNG